MQSRFGFFIIGTKGFAEEVRYDPNYFEYGKWGFVKIHILTGFAGFKVLWRPWLQED